jgi:hypothetical protein
MIRKQLGLILISIAIFAASCGLTPPPGPQPQLSATDVPPQVTAMSELPPTWTPVPTNTPSPTLPPSPTPVPTQDPENYRIELALPPATAVYPDQAVDRSGWQTLAGDTASIEIPSEYEVLDFAGIFMEMMFGVMEAFVEGFTEMAEDLGEELGVTPEAELETPDLGDPPEFDFLIAMEEDTQSAIILVSVEIDETTTTQDLLNEALNDQENDINPVSRIEYIDAPYPMERLVLDIEDEELGPGKQVIYVILGEKMGWNVVFTCPADQYQEKLALFESVVASFQINH